MNLDLQKWGATPPPWINASLLSDIADLCEEVCTMSQVEPRQLFINRRGPQRVARTRQLAMALIRQRHHLTFEDIGQLFGGRDHGTVIHAIKAVDISRATAYRRTTAWEAEGVIFKTTQGDYMLVESSG